MNLDKPTTREHFARFKAMTDKIFAAHGDAPIVAKTFMGRTQDHWMGLFWHDPLLNNIPVREFDNLYFNYRQFFSDDFSLADNVCMLKHHIAYNIVGAKPIFAGE